MKTKAPGGVAMTNTTMANMAISRRASSVAAIRVADWLSLAAAPTFAVMALVTAIFDSAPDALCLAAQGSPFSGMVVMYVLMSVFHVSPWLRLIYRSGLRPRPVRSAARDIQGC